jgi:hypothetical protein
MGQDTLIEKENMLQKGGFEQIYHVCEGYLRKIPVERRYISRVERREKFSHKTGIFRKYPSQYDISV